MFLTRTTVLLTVLLLIFSKGYTQSNGQSPYFIPLHCVDKNSGMKYDIGKSWTDLTECVKYDCENNPVNGAAFTVATMCVEDKNINKNKCYKLPGNVGPFPQCCPRWICLGDGNLKTIVQEKTS